MKKLACKICGKSLEKTQLQFCSKKCLGKHKSFTYKGINNPNWRDGSSSKESPLYNAKRKYIKKFPEKNRARNILYQAIRLGNIKRLPCEICGNKKSEGHHEDYLKPKDVRWLCRKHHMEAHGNKWRNY